MMTMMRRRVRMMMRRRRVRMMMMRRRRMWRIHPLPLAASGLERSRPLRGGGGLATSAASAEAMATSAASAPQAAVAAGDCRCDMGLLCLTDEPPNLPDWWRGPARWMPCTCTSCGPAERDGGRRCVHTVHPMVVVWRRGEYLCEDCWESCETRAKRTAAAAAGREEKRQKACEHVAKEQGSGAEATAPGGPQSRPPRSTPQWRPHRMTTRQETPRRTGWTL